MTRNTYDPQMLKEPHDFGPPGRLSRWRHTLIDNVDREALEQQLIDNGGLSWSYIFLVITSCAIATLGLMLNSGAVIIGAMLVAPLMGPIVLLGYAIARTDVLLGIRSAKALAVGVISALAISVSIVKLSPFIGPTPEILSRTHPNLFDMLVAIFAGLVGGYALIRRQAGTIAGVAIATALMPPLCTSGYGLATANLAICKGGFFLFLTNMLAIAFSIAGVAAWYGLATLRTPKELIWKTVTAGLVLLLLSIPLIDSLNRSVQKTVISNQVETVLRAYLDQAQARLGNLHIEEQPDGTIAARAIVFTPSFDATAANQIEQQLKSQCHMKVDLQLDQVVLAKENIPAADLSPALTSSKPEISDSTLLNQYLQRLSSVPFAVTSINGDTRAARLQVANSYGGNMSVLWHLEKTLQAEFPDWQIAVIPPIKALPPVYFPADQSRPDDVSAENLNMLRWYLQRTQVANITLAGYSASNERDSKGNPLAMQRAAAVAGLLQDLHLKANLIAVPRSLAQRRQERESGWTAYRKVEIIPDLNALVSADEGGDRGAGQEASPINLPQQKATPEDQAAN